MKIQEYKDIKVSENASLILELEREFDVHELAGKLISLMKQNEKNEEDLNLLWALESAGVDNWEGYDDAMDSLRD